MTPTSIRIDRKNKTVTIVMELQKPHPSRSSGKTKVIATTAGLRTSDESYARRPVLYTANAFFFPKNAKETKDHSATIKEEVRPTKRSSAGRRDLSASND